MKHAFTSSYATDGSAGNPTVEAPQWNDTHVRGITSLSANTTLASTHDLVLATAGATGITLTLPAANARAGQRFTIVNVDGGAGGVTISRAGTDTIMGQTSYKLTNKWQYVEIVGDGSSSWVVTDHGSPV